MNKPSRKSTRLKEYDYSQTGYYFVTICSYKQESIFGNIINDRMNLNSNGKIVDQAIDKLPHHYPDILIDYHVIMPNHIHIIINIVVGAGFSRQCNNTNIDINGRENPAPTLGQIIAYFKYDTTKKLNNLKNSHIKKIWQRSFYDHIIRNEKSLNEIRQYILNNPLNWDNDNNNLNNQQRSKRKRSNDKNYY